MDTFWSEIGFCLHRDRTPILKSQGISPGKNPEFLFYNYDTRHKMKTVSKTHIVMLLTDLNCTF